jgi:hypothetical protein
LAIQGVDLNFTPNFTRVIDNQPRNIARPRREIDNAEAIPSFDPTAKEVQDKGIAAKETIESAQILEMPFQFR